MIMDRGEDLCRFMLIAGVVFASLALVSEIVVETPEISDEVKDWVELVQLDYLKDSLLGDFVQDKIDAEMYKKSRLFLTKCERDGKNVPSTYTIDDGVVVFDWNGVIFKRMDE
jgi:hypothetical protein